MLIDKGEKLKKKSAQLSPNKVYLIPLSTIQKILTNPFCYGHFRYRGEIHQGSHKPMISKKLFDKIQQALKDNGKPRKKPKVKDFPFLGFAKCGLFLN